MSKISTVESLRKEVDEKISQVVASSTANAIAIESLRCMLEGFLGRSKDVVEGSPSLIESALENQESGGMRQMVLAGIKLKSQPKVVSMAGLADSGTRIKRVTTVGNVEGGGRVSKFHFAAIPNGWLKVDVLDIVQLGVALMLPNDNVDMRNIPDAKEIATVWNQQYIRHAS